MAIIHNIKMIHVSDLQTAINIQYDLEATREDIALALDKNSWIEGAHEIYIGPDLGLTLDLENCIIAYLRDILPNDEYIYINFDW